MTIPAVGVVQPSALACVPMDSWAASPQAPGRMQSGAKVADFVSDMEVSFFGYGSRVSPSQGRPTFRKIAIRACVRAEFGATEPPRPRAQARWFGRAAWVARHMPPVLSHRK